MNASPQHFIGFLAAFLIGSFPTGYLAVKWVQKTDIRKQGSGNVGATNVLRVLGKKWGLLVFGIDFMKGFLPLFVFLKFTSDGLADPSSSLIWLGSGSILGHIFTPFLGFKGGKGIATGAGVLCAYHFLLWAAVLAVWAVVFSFTRIVSLSSLAALLALAGFSFTLKVPLRAGIFFGFVVVLLIWTHRSNITRLLSRTESKIS